MFFPQFLVAMLTASAVVAIWTYLATGSFWKALAWTFLALIVLQVGYLLLAFGLFYLRPTKGIEEEPEPPQPIRRNGGVSLTPKPKRRQERQDRGAQVRRR